MKYQKQEITLTLEQRKQLNEKVLYLIDSGAKEADFTGEDIYNAYTGDGGLHGLERGDFENYHLRWYTPDGDCLSQLYYCMKAAELLKPLGILALVVPQSFLADSFADGTAIREMESRFSFLGQVCLPDNAFRQMGVSDFPTKLQFWQRKSELDGWTARRYYTETLYFLSHGFDPAEEAKRLYERVLMLPKAELEQNKSRVMLELARSHQGTGQFAYETQKLLYQIKVHSATKDKYMKCCEYLHRFYTQERPQNMDYEEWERKKLTEPKVLAYLRRALRIVRCVSAEYSSLISCSIRRIMRNQATTETNFSPVSHDKHRISISVLKIFANFLRVWATRRSGVGCLM